MKEMTSRRALLQSFDVTKHCFIIMVERLSFDRTWLIYKRKHRITVLALAEKLFGNIKATLPEKAETILSPVDSESSPQTETGNSTLELTLYAKLPLNPQENADTSAPPSGAQ